LLSNQQEQQQQKQEQQENPVASNKSAIVEGEEKIKERCGG